MEIKQVRKEARELEKKILDLINKFEISTKVPVESIRVISNSNNVIYSIAGYAKNVVISTKKVKLHNI